MPFSATVRGSLNLGGAGGIKMTYGDWSGNAGDASNTVPISGGYPLVPLFFKLDADNTYEILPKVTSSVSGSVTTLTVENQDNVTTGRFIIFHGGQ